MVQNHIQGHEMDWRNFRSNHSNIGGQAELAISPTGDKQQKISTDMWKIQKRVEWETFIDGTNGNEDINWTDTVVNDAVIDLDNMLRNPISDVELPSVKLSNDAILSLSSGKHPGLAEA